MEKIKLGKSGLLVPPIALGCMRLAGAERTQADAFLHTALELELNFFDHADIYGGGACERVFGEMIKDAGVRREDLIIQSKCAIVPGKMYDFSKEHILSAVDGSLKRLGTDYLDVLLLHRPDALMERQGAPLRRLQRRPVHDGTFAERFASTDLRKPVANEPDKCHDDRAADEHKHLRRLKPGAR